MFAYDSDPICACSTPAGISGIAVIRVSGDGCALLADKCTKIYRACEDIKKVSELKGYTCAYGSVINPQTNAVTDEVVFTKFDNPHSYTGEDMLEISCHGSSAVKQEILRILGMCGIRLAYPGEFSRRAFINGKMSLASAEAVMDVINADSDRQLAAAGSLMSGALADKIASLESELYKAMAIIEMLVEFDHDEDDTEQETKDIEKVKDILIKQHKVLYDLVDGYDKGRILSERMRVALIGLPNSGKSTILNTLTGFDRAIVTEVAGTTRDTIEVALNVDGIPVTLIDTAGLRQTEDFIESIGIGRAMDAGRNADLVFYVISPDLSIEEAEDGISELAEDIGGEYITAVFSKSDEGDNPDREEIEEVLRDYGITKFISVSAEEGLNIDKLEDVIREYYDSLGGRQEEGMLITNERHYNKLDKALGYLDMSVQAMSDLAGIEICSSTLRSCLDEIGEVTGKTVSAQLADTIFSRFCIGK
ncbi:MAG: tRNA uridine-5-carboxymethylaminomethyl(34) synthesis GTPase MnmE [Saccharofermentans sp.]|nr:tRNA uridine-5-carboxymethylaminomethyl(34) synthesis GTPase MnmE [Saccharofermentans sp.]